MALGQHEPVPILPLGVGRVDVHFLEIQIGEHIRSGQASAGMARLGAVGALNDAHAHLASINLKLFLFQFCHAESP